MSSEAAKRAVAKYQREQMESISIRVKRAEGLYNRIKQAATVQGVKPAQFIKKALVTALDGPQPVQAQTQPQTQPATNAAPTAPANIPDQFGMEYLRVLLPASMRYNERISEAVYNGAAKSEKIFVMQALDRRLHEADQMME